MQLRVRHAVPSNDDTRARAYLDLLATTRPLTATTPDQVSSASSGPLRALRRTSPGRLGQVKVPQRTSPGYGSPVGPKATALLGKRAMTVAFIAGISVAGVSPAADNANQVQAAPLSRTQPVRPTPTTSAPGPTIASGRAGVVSVASIEPPPETRPNLSSARVRRKVKPVPVLTVKWVNPLPEAAVTSCFGHRWGRLHAGVDLAAPNGTRIRGAGAGVVVSAGVAQGYGNAVLIDHGNGFLTHYGHMSVITVLVGQKLAVGQEIGLEGSTGNSTGPHLHFEVHQGTYQNPIEPTGWLREHGVAIPGCAPAAVPAEPPV